MSTDTVAAVGHCEQIEDASNMAPGRPSSALNNPIFPLQVQVLYMSGHVDDESISIEELGQRPFIAKPFAPRDLLVRVRETLDELPLTATPQKE